jgi:topoisomerase-4 subunit A
LLKKELEIELGELEEKWHFASLERIFIENEIYQEIKGKNSKEEVYAAIDKALKPFTKNLKREVTTEDIIRLTELPFMRISRYDRDKAEENILALEGKMEQVKHHLANLVTYAIDYFTNIQKKYGKDKERKTELRIFDTIDATKVVLANEKFYVNRAEGFIGTSLKKTNMYLIVRILMTSLP